MERAAGARRVTLASRAAAETESLVLSLVGAGLGFLVARWGSRLLVQQLSTQTSSVFLELSVDWRVLAFTTAITALTALLFGTAPAFRAAGVAPMEAIKDQGRGAGGETGRMSVAALTAGPRRSSSE